MGAASWTAPPWARTHTARASASVSTPITTTLTTLGLRTRASSTCAIASTSRWCDCRASLGPARGWHLWPLRAGGRRSRPVVVVRVVVRGVMVLAGVRPLEAAEARGGDGHVGARLRQGEALPERRGLLDAPLLEEQRPQRVPHRLHPRPGLVVGEAVRQRHRL